MVLGLRTKGRRGTSVHVEYTVHLAEIKPWPPSQSLRAVRSVVLRWDNGDRSSGSSSAVVPEDGKIVIRESFKLRTVLQQQTGQAGSFQKNLLELNLYELRRDRPGREQHLGSAAVDLAAHGVVREPVSLCAPLSCRRSYRNAGPPVLFLTIEPFRHSDADEEEEIASFTDEEEAADAIEEGKGSLKGFGERLRELEARAAGLEAELREAAGLEVGAYGVAAEHGGSVGKVHAPARRLLRLHRRGGGGAAASSAASGLILAARACGNDVPRLTFWLSNAVVLRTAVAEGIDLSRSKSKVKDLSTLRWESLTEAEAQSLEEPSALVSELEKIETWIFSRIVESLWWQTLSPRMHALGQINGPQVKSPLRLWREAFKDACEKICPARAHGHDCGCLPMLPKLIMGQCVTRLDVALFNALLREPDDDLPTDPISDPITDPRILPIAADRFSFGSGVQLKNTIGNWSRGLSNWFGMDDDSADAEEVDSPLQRKKLFHLLNALSDLLMLPKDMLLDQSIRNEACPCFEAPVLRRILTRFKPDEFCPDSIPENLLSLLDLEGELPATGHKEVGSIPCTAAPVVYSPPSPATVANIIGGGTIFRKSITSDDELDELIYSNTSFQLMSPIADFREVSIRHQLLRQLWTSED